MPDIDYSYVTWKPIPLVPPRYFRLVPAQTPGGWRWEEFWLDHEQLACQKAERLARERYEHDA